MPHANICETKNDRRSRKLKSAGWNFKLAESHQFDFEDQNFSAIAPAIWWIGPIKKPSHRSLPRSLFMPPLTLPNSKSGSNRVLLRSTWIGTRHYMGPLLKLTRIPHSFGPTHSIGATILCLATNWVKPNCTSKELGWETYRKLLALLCYHVEALAFTNLARRVVLMCVCVCGAYMMCVCVPWGTHS